MIDRLTIDPRYNGPNTSGNGGWVAGSLARLLGTGPVSVSLRAPAPLAVPMLVRRREDGTVTLENDGVLVAEGGRSHLELDVPNAPNPDEAEAAGTLAQKVSAQGVNGPYAHCFSCGFARSDGLRIVPGPVGEDGVVATTWTPPSFAADASGRLSVEATWAALDCSAGFAWMQRLGAATAIITARMTAVIDQLLQADRRHTVIGWPIAQDGRKLHAGTAIFDANGRVLARSRQLWLIQRT
ncbi:MAG TPA: hypothetical protein VK652_07705 [Steroidobacteraceae bacterium]|nr:hypothetical protein [Steroidobacteraceae bacterium]